MKKIKKNIVKYKTHGMLQVINTNLSKRADI